MNDILPPWPDLEWMRDARRDQAMEAIADSLSRMAFEIEWSQNSYARRHPGAKWDEKAERDYRTLTAAAAFLTMTFAGARGVALEVAKANKQKGSEYHQIPIWITRLGDQLKNAFCAPLPASQEKAHDARMEDVA